MTTALAEPLRDALSIALELLVFRATPPLVFMLVTGEATLRGRAIAAALYAALLGASAGIGMPLERAAAGASPLLVFAAMAVVVYRLRAPFASGALTRAGLFAVCALGYLLLPALLAPARLLTPLLVMGWDLTLSGYSYVVDTSARRKPATLADCVFFLLVNPTLVYAERGRQVGAPALPPTALLRIALGVASVMAYRLLPLLIAPVMPALLSVPSAGRYLAWLASYGARVGAIALSHSGLASMQIGLMRLLGHQVPERYAFPLLAASPQEFWRRWNIWVGHWAQRYVFQPLALHAARRHRALPPLLGKALAAIATFALLGALHDLFQGLQAVQSNGQPLTWRWTQAFLLLGATFIGWIALQRPLGSVRRRLGIAPPVSRVLAWAAFMHLLLLAVYLVDPGAPVRLPGLIDP